MTESVKNARCWQNLLAEFRRLWPTGRWRDVGVVVGCSGGADSVALLTVMNQLRAGNPDEDLPPARGFLVAAHFNHQQRAEASDGDEQFVKQLASKQGIQFAAARGTGRRTDEANLRSERMEFLIDIAHSTGARYVVLAHSLDDNAETVLHHLLRGTGPTGLAGIHRSRPLADDLVLVRPLLSIRRSDIRAGLTEIGQPWREDASNDDTAYRRNWIRHRLIPLIESQFPQAVDAIARATEHHQSWRVVIERLAEEWIEENLETEVPLKLRRNQPAENAVVVMALQRLWDRRGWARGEMTRDHWSRLAQTLRSTEPERYTLPGRIDVSGSQESVEIV